MQGEGRQEEEAVAAAPGAGGPADGAEEPFETWDGIEFLVLERPTTTTEPLVMQFRLPDGCGSPPPHIHAALTETYEVVEGALEMLVGEEWRTMEAGETLVVTPGMRHSFRNTSGAPAVVRNTHAPHGDFEPFIRSYAALTHELRSAEPKSPKGAIQGAVLWASYPQLGTVTDQPLRTLVPVLARLGRALGITPPAPA